MNVRRSLIQELILFKLKLGHDTDEATKNIFCAKVPLITVISLE